MSENIEYHRGYSDGFREGYNKALEFFKDGIINRPMQILISKEELLDKVCKGKCYLYNTEHCKPNGLTLFDATTCKSFHTEESFKELNKS